MRVAFRVDASPQIGGGHLMRCLTLAVELAAAGADAVFVGAAVPDPMGRLIRDAGFRLVDISSAAAAASCASRSGRAHWPDALQHADADQVAIALGDDPVDWIVVDHYGLDAAWQARLRSRVGRIAVVDDLADRRHDCDLLIDQTYGREAQDYAALTPAHADIRVGAGYALLRPEFAASRPMAIERHCAAGPVARVLISLGMTDVGGLTRVAADAALTATDAQVDIVMGSAAPTLAAIRDFAAVEPRVRLHIDTPDVCALMTAADLAIGAAGSTSWERCCLGLPAITIVTAANQRLIAAKLSAAGAIRLLDTPDAGTLNDAVLELSANAAERAGLARTSSAICDGAGAARVASRLFEQRSGAWTA